MPSARQLRPLILSNNFSLRKFMRIKISSKFRFTLAARIDLRLQPPWTAASAGCEQQVSTVGEERGTRRPTGEGSKVGCKVRAFRELGSLAEA